MVVCSFQLAAVVLMVKNRDLLIWPVGDFSSNQDFWPPMTFERPIGFPCSARRTASELSAIACAALFGRLVMSRRFDLEPEGQG